MIENSTAWQQAGKVAGDRIDKAHARRRAVHRFIYEHPNCRMADIRAHFADARTMTIFKIVRRLCKGDHVDTLGAWNNPTYHAIADDIEPVSELREILSEAGRATASNFKPHNERQKAESAMRRAARSADAEKRKATAAERRAKAEAARKEAAPQRVAEPLSELLITGRYTHRSAHLPSLRDQGGHGGLSSRYSATAMELAL